MAFYTFGQNNSGGIFDYDAEAGISHYVIVEADSALEAEERAEGIGLYWNGCDTGRDCDCCGDRWSASNWEFDGTVEPTIWSDTITSDYTGSGMGMKRMDGFEIFIHYQNGAIEGIWK